MIWKSLGGVCGGRVLPDISYVGMCVPPQRVGFLCRFGLKMGIDFAHICLESVMVFEGTTGVYECILLFLFQNSKKESEMCEYEMDFKNPFFVGGLI